MHAAPPPVAYARADFGAAAPTRVEQAAPAAALGAAASHASALTRLPVDPSATAEKSRDKLKQRESAERREGKGRLVDISV